ncbi:unnamed protein product [Chrysoparadoxa australica]
MRSKVQEAGGEFLHLPRKQMLSDLFGDPCPGKIKQLVIQYEVLGTEGRAEALESAGKLTTPISISSTPILAPLILVKKVLAPRLS